VVLNAAVLGSPPLSQVEKLSTESLIATFTVNVAGNIQVLQAAASYWDSASSPTVIAFTSDAESAGYEGWASYGSSKAALNLIIKTYQSEHPNHHVYVVDPGDMDTAMHREALPDDPGPLRQPLDVAQALSPLWSAPPPSGRYIVHGSTDVLTLKKEG
jgi:NAD(P)-dependent dehydrogenase (short-subunit alcohol dehydrogenase family)